MRVQGPATRRPNDSSIAGFGCEPEDVLDPVSGGDVGVLLRLAWN